MLGGRLFTLHPQVIKGYQKFSATPKYMVSRRSGSLPRSLPCNSAGKSGLALPKHRGTIPSFPLQVYN